MYMHVENWWSLMSLMALLKIFIINCLFSKINLGLSFPITALIPVNSSYPQYFNLTLVWWRPFWISYVYTFCWCCHVYLLCFNFDIEGLFWYNYVSYFDWYYCIREGKPSVIVVKFPAVYPSHDSGHSGVIPYFLYWEFIWVVTHFLAPV